MKHINSDITQYRKSIKTSVKIYHLKISSQFTPTNTIDDYQYIGSFVLDAFSTDALLKKAWSLTQNDGQAWSLNSYFNNNSNAVSFRSSKVGDVFEIMDIGFFKISSNGFTQIDM